MVLLHLHCPSGASLRYATQFVTLLAAHTVFVTAATVSFMPLHSFRPSFRFITPRSQLLYCYKAWHTSGTQGKAKVMHKPFRKPALQYSLGSIPLHYVIHSLQ